MKIAILTHFGSFQPGYALHVGWLERAKMLEYYNQDFDFLVDRHVSPNTFPHTKNVLRTIPSGEPFEKRVKFFENQYMEILQEYDVVLTADLIYQRGGNFLAYNQAIRNVIPKLDCKWFHWIHSAWVKRQEKEYPENLRFEPLDKSTLVYMNESELKGVAQMYNMPLDKIACVWNTKDYRSFNNFHKLSYRVVDILDIQNKDIIQLFPHCTTRMDSKGIDAVIEVFAAIKKQDKEVALIFANSNSSTKEMQKLIQHKKNKMHALGLYDKRDFLFTSDIVKNHGALPREAVADLFQVSNVFVFASWREVSPNVVLEAKINGNLLVMSEGLPCAREFAGNNAIYFNATHKVPGIQDGLKGDTKKIIHHEEYLENLAKEIINKTQDRKYQWEFSFNNIWEKQFRPLLYGPTNQNITAGLVSVSWFPLSAELVSDLAKYVDYLVLWFDLPKEKGGAGDRKILEECKERLDYMGCKYKVIESDVKWSQWKWREVLIRELDKVKPGHVIALDSDEQIDPTFYREFEEFKRSRFSVMLAMPEMITADGREVEKTPTCMHCKAFKWYPGITYKPYQGYALPNMPVRPKPTYRTNSFYAKSKYKHYCYYTPEIEKLHKENKEWRGI